MYDIDSMRKRLLDHKRNIATFEEAIEAERSAMKETEQIIYELEVREARDGVIDKPSTVPEADHGSGSRH
jgi:hypothetical protein